MVQDSFFFNVISSQEIALNHLPGSTPPGYLPPEWNKSQAELGDSNKREGTARKKGLLPAQKPLHN